MMEAQAQLIGLAKERTSETVEPMLVEDERLISQARAGDELAFEQLVTKYGRRVLGIAARFFRQPEAREDIAQEVFLKVYQSLDVFRRGEPFEPWLTTITLNTCYDHLRQMKRRKELKLSEICEEEIAWLERQRFDQAMKTFESERAREIAAGLAEKVLETLSPEDRMVLLLYERDGFSTAEIARIMGWSRANVKVRLFRARRAMRQTLEQIEGWTS
jgi:RNA polymerase sigma-70 factor (ECF subfamily)